MKTRHAILIILILMTIVSLGFLNTKTQKVLLVRKINGL